MRPGPPGLVCRRQQRFQPGPDHVKQCWRWCGRLLLGGRWRVPLSLTVVIIAGPGLVPPAPLRPVQEACHALRCRSPELPKQPADFGRAQADWSPRWALKRAKLVAVGPCPPFLGAASAPVSARRTVKNACAHMANVMWRYHPVQLRTS